MESFRLDNDGGKMKRGYLLVLRQLGDDPNEEEKLKRLCSYDGNTVLSIGSGFDLDTYCIISVNIDNCIVVGADRWY